MLRLRQSPPSETNCLPTHSQSQMGREMGRTIAHLAHPIRRNSSQESTSPLKAISHFALPLTTSKGRLARRMLCRWSATTRIPQSPSNNSSFEPDSSPAPLLAILERLLAAPALSDAAPRHSLFGGSSSPSRPPLLSFPTRLICTVLRYHSPFTSFTNTHDSRYSPFAIL
jgi:hypothetical protein